MPFTDLSRSRGIQFKPLSKAAFFIFVGNFLILMELGAKHVESPFIEFGQISTVVYFAQFLIIVPLISLFENTLIDITSKKGVIYHMEQPTHISAWWWESFSYLDKLEILKKPYRGKLHGQNKLNFVELIEESTKRIAKDGHLTWDGHKFGYDAVNKMWVRDDGLCSARCPIVGYGGDGVSDRGPFNWTTLDQVLNDKAITTQDYLKNNGLDEETKKAYVDAWAEHVKTRITSKHAMRGERVTFREGRGDDDDNGQGGTGGAWMSSSSAGIGGGGGSSGGAGSSSNAASMDSLSKQYNTPRPQGITSQLNDLVELHDILFYLSIILSIVVLLFRIKILWDIRNEIIMNVLIWWWTIQLFFYHYKKLILTLLGLFILILLSASMLFVALTVLHPYIDTSVSTTSLLHCDAPRPWGIYFQDSATPQMEALVELHDNILFYLVIILFGVGWLLVSIVKSYTNTESPVTHKYLSHGTLVELIWTITPALILILIAFPSFKLLYLMDEVSDPAMVVLAEGFFTGGLKLHILNKRKDTSLTVFAKHHLFAKHQTVLVKKTIL